MTTRTAPGTERLELDAGSLDPAELSMGALTREINLRVKPNALLRMMMGSLEKKRQAKKLGWSRPWNKTGMTVFRSDRFDLASETDLARAWGNGLLDASAGMPREYRDFVLDLWDDASRMAFAFYHNQSESGREYEGLTLSLGRKIPDDKSKRDRIDIVFGDLRRAGAVDRIPDWVRIYVNPFSAWKSGEMWSISLKGGDIPEPLLGLYGMALDAYRRNGEMPDRQWNHWAFRYIDYFGPRTFIPRGSAFI
jgi:hypothetical protein